MERPGVSSECPLPLTLVLINRALNCVRGLPALPHGHSSLAGRTGTSSRSGRSVRATRHCGVNGRPPGSSPQSAAPRVFD